jgi:hypothetical protein
MCLVEVCRPEFSFSSLNPTSSIFLWRSPPKRCQPFLATCTCSLEPSSTMASVLIWEPPQTPATVLEGNIFRYSSVASNHRQRPSTTVPSFNVCKTSPSFLTVFPSRYPLPELVHRATHRAKGIRMSVRDKDHGLKAGESQRCFSRY